MAVIKANQDQHPRNWNGSRSNEPNWSCEWQWRQSHKYLEKKMQWNWQTQKRENLRRWRVDGETKISGNGEGIRHSSKPSQRLLPHPAGIASHRHPKAQKLAFFPDSNWNWRAQWVPWTAAWKLVKRLNMPVRSDRIPSRFEKITPLSYAFRDYNGSILFFISNLLLYLQMVLKLAYG